MRYLVQPRYRIFLRSYKFLSFAKNMGKIIGNNRSKNLSSKFSQKTSQSNGLQMHLKLSQKE